MKINCAESNQDGAGQTTDDQFEDDCHVTADRAISACSPPRTLCLVKLSPRSWSWWWWWWVGVGLCTDISHPALQLLAPEIKQSFRFPGGSEVKASAFNAGDPGSIRGLGSSPGEGNGNPLQYS